GPVRHRDGQPLPAHGPPRAARGGRSHGVPGGQPRRHRAVHAGGRGRRPAGAALMAFLAANPGATASFTQGVAATGQGDVVAGFSSRGPGTEWIKPDLSAPGVQILAGHTPVPDELAGGPPGNLYQAIAGTSMSSPHVAGAAALLMDLHPDWSPGQVRSALQLTANTNVVKTHPVTPAHPFDVGSGRIQVDAAAPPNLTLDESAADFAAAATDPLARIDLN